MDSNHDIASLPPLRAEFAGGTFRGITTRKDGTHCAVILLPNKATERRNWQACVDWAREAGGELPTRSVFHLLRLSATKEELAEGGWYYTADLLSDDTGDEDDAAYAWYCFLYDGFTGSNRKSYEGLAVAVRLIPLTSPAKVGGDERELPVLPHPTVFAGLTVTNEPVSHAYSAHQMVDYARAALSADGGEDSGRFPALTELLAAHASELESNAYAYFELAYTRHTEWMAWICSNSRESDPVRKVIAHGQGATPEEACRAAIAAKAKGE